MIAAEAVAELREIVGVKAVLDRPQDLMLYEYDGSVDKHTPDCVVFPTTTEDDRTHRPNGCTAQAARGGPRRRHRDYREARSRWKAGC